MTWQALVSVDQTAGCVFLIILSLSLLWVYVSMMRGKTEQPNFNILYQTSEVGNKRAQKNKGRRKYVSLFGCGLIGMVVFCC